MTGFTGGAFTGTNAGSNDIFLTKYDSNGTQQWMRQTGTSALDLGRDVAVDSSGNAYVSGATRGAFTGTNAGSGDIFLTKYDSSGNQQWITQIGTSEDDHGRGVVVDSAGNAYVTGRTDAAFTGTNLGGNDIFLTKYDTSGYQQWITQIGTSGDDRARGVAVDSSGNAYVTGLTYGALTGSNAGGGDVFLLKYDTNGNLQ